jgi:glycosyltransferase involved in cell wall biosynthesis
MRIGIIAPPWVPIPGVGYGLEIVVDHLARGLDEAGQEVMLCAAADSTCPVPRAPGMMPSVGLPGLGVRYELCHVVDSYRALQRWGPDVVHDHTVAGALYADRVNCPVVITNHEPFSDHARCYYETVADRVPIVAISEHHASTAGDVPIARVILNGIDVDDCPVGLGEGDYALWLGRFDHEKGAHEAIAAAAIAGVPIKLAACPPRPIQEPYFREFVEPWLGPDVEWIGAVSGTRKHAVLAGARCLVNPVQWPEPFGLTMAEALAHGTPVVASRLGSCPELITHDVTGYLCDGPRQLANGIEDAAYLDRAACRKAAVARFSTRRMVADHLDLYRQVAA